jgi:hypothetical protein
MLDEHASGHRSNHNQMYLLLMLEFWFRTMEPPISSPMDSVRCRETASALHRTRDGYLSRIEKRSRLHLWL